MAEGIPSLNHIRVKGKGMPFADGYEMTEEQAVLILLDMLNGMTPPENVKQKAYRTIILEWLDRESERHPRPMSRHFNWPKDDRRKQK